MALILENVGKTFENTGQATLKNINLTLHPGENLAVVGLNGAGKTTLIKIICGFLDPTKGQVKLNGTDIRNYNRKFRPETGEKLYQKSRLASKNRSSSR